MVAGTRVAANRRKVSVMEEERDRAEAAAHFQAYVRERERGERNNGRLHIEICQLK